MNLGTTQDTLLAGCVLESVIATDEIQKRKNRDSDVPAEFNALTNLTKELARSPEQFFQKLVNTALKLTLANSTGISLLDEKNGRFVWPAVAGGLHCYLGEGTPQNFGPCGTVLDRNAPVLFLHPEKHFTYLEPIAPPLREVLLVPFHVNFKAVGTIWAVIHDEARNFQPEDLRLLVSLSGYAASAYKVLSDIGAIEPLFHHKKKAI
jgi:GAF domain-containing protein